MIARSVLITGANRGIGLGLVKELVHVEHLQHLFVGCRRPNEAPELQDIATKHSKVVLLNMDVTEEESIKQSIDVVSKTVSTDGLNCLINNAGIMDKFKPIENVSADDLRDLYETNTIGPFLLTKACLPLLRCASNRVHGLYGCDYMGVSRAAVVNMSSILGSIEENNMGRNYGYRMSKASMNMLTKNLSVELHRDNILCVSLHPGWVKTGMGGERAPLTVETAVKGIVDVLSNLGAKDTGTFYGFDGREIDW